MTAPDEDPSHVCSACGAEMGGDGNTCFQCGHERRSPPLKKGQVVAGRYELLGILGRGGMGTVYEAHDRSLDERVALKVLSESAQGSADADRRFRAEIKLARKIRHPNVCAIHEYGEHEAIPYIVMELVKGQNLKKHLRAAGRVPAHEAIAIAYQIGEGLQAIHDAGVIHRDLKLSNVMMDSTGRVRLMDFGIAKGVGDTMATVTGLILGTPEYMSPEQIQGQRVDPRTDIYSLGIMTYEMLTGRVPFRADTPLATIMLQVREPPRLDDPAIPPAVVPVLGRALAKEPDDRYQSAREYVTALSAIALSLPSFAPDPFSPATLADISTMEMATPRFLIRPREAEPASVTIQPGEGRRWSDALGQRWPWIAALGGALVLATALAVQVIGRRPAEPSTTDSTASAVPSLDAAATSGVTGASLKAPSPALSDRRVPSPRPAGPTQTVQQPADEKRSVTTPAPATRASLQGPSSGTRSTSAREAEAQRAAPSPAGASSASARAGQAVAIPEIPPATPTAVSTPATRLTPPIATGRLQLGASPYAQVTVDGKDAGTLPLRPLELAPGQHVVRFAHPSYQPLQRTVTIRSGETAKLFVDWKLDGIAK